MATFSETTIQPDFYSPWPKFGKPFSRQLNESRSNADNLHPISRAVGFDPGYSDARSAAVAAVEVGENNFHNKYRIWWDKTDSSFRIQRNTGTTGGPTWTDSIVIGSSGEVVGDFYVPSDNLPTSGITVKQSDDIELFSGITTVSFETASFYITQNADTNIVHVNFRGTAGGGGGGGVTAHSALTGLIAPADDHTQYLLASAATDRATFATNWTDLTDAGATTLHKHDHGGLDGLTDDDHAQYLLISGTRAMTGDLLMGSNDILNAYKGVFNDQVTAEAFYIKGSSFFVNNLGAGTIEGPGIQFTSTVSAIAFDSNTSMSLDSNGDMNIASGSGEVFIRSESSFVNIEGDESVRISIKDENRVFIGIDGVRVEDKVKAEAFYIPGGQPVHFVTTTNLGGSFTPKEFRSPGLIFNRSDFYITENSTGDPIVNLSGSAPISQVLAVLSADMLNLTGGTSTALTGLVDGGVNIGGWTIGTSSITVPSGISNVKVKVQVELSADTAGGTRSLQILKNGVGYKTNLNIESKVRGGAAAEPVILQAISFILDVTSGDTLGAAVTVSTGNVTDVLSSLAGVRKTWLYVEEVRATGSSGPIVTITDGSLPNYQANTINLNPSQFYLTPTSSGPMINLVDPLDRVIITDGVNIQEDNVINFSAAEFYVSTNLRGEPVINLLSPSGSGTALTVADELAPTFTSVSKITFDDYFYLNPDSTGQPKVSFINKFKLVTVVATTDQSLTNGTATDIVFGTTVINIGSWGVSLGTGEITVPAGVTHVRVTSQLSWEASSGATNPSRRQSAIALNGSSANITPTIASNAHSTNSVTLGIRNNIASHVFSVVQGDIITLQGNQLQGSSASTDGNNNLTWLSVEGFDYD